mgnify:CR=1 FL=1
MDNATFRVVYNVVVHNKKITLDEDVLVKSIEVASKNKVLLHFLRALGISNDVRFREEARYTRFLRNLNVVVNALEDLDYVFIKLRKPVLYVPADIDVLVIRNQVPEAVSRLVRRGFGIKVVEPYCVTMVSKSAIVDLYVYPTLGGMIYLDATGLLEHRVFTELSNIEVPVLETYAEALLAIAHAVYKERIYTLNDYVTVRAWISAKAIKLAEELNCLNAVREALTMHRLVERQRLVLPYRISFAKWLGLLGSKILQDRLAKATLSNLSKTLKDRRFGKLILSKMVRDTY